MGACEDVVGLSICDGPMETVFINRWVPLDTGGWLAGIGLYTVHWLQRCQWLFLSLLISGSHHYG